MQAHWLPVTSTASARGRMRVGERDIALPFAAERFFIVDDVPVGDIRGDHAHRTCHQLLICTVGRVLVTTQGGEGGPASFLATPESGCVHIPPLVWATQQYETADSQLLVLASEPYDADEYIRDRGEFEAIIRAPLDLAAATRISP